MSVSSERYSRRPRLAVPEREDGTKGKWNMLWHISGARGFEKSWGSGRIYGGGQRSQGCAGDILGLINMADP